MDDDELRLLNRSLVDERDLVLRPRLARLEVALKQILELADAHDQVSADDTLVQVGHLVEAALQL